MTPEAKNLQEEIQSSATIKGHPIHPMAVVFPIASLVGVLVSDFIYLLTNDSFWPQASYYLLISGIITGIGAAIFGAIDFFFNSKIRRLKQAWLHAGGNLLLMFLAIINFLIRNQNTVSALLPWGLVLSLFSVLLLIFTGWYGGELVYRYKVGVDSRQKDKMVEEKSSQDALVNRADLS